MAMIGKVPRMHHREKKSVREIVRATSLSRNTVRKFLRTPVAPPPKYRRKAAMTKLGPFVETVKMALLADARRPKKERRTAKALLQQLADAGYQGGYTQLTDFIRAWRAQQGGVAVGKVNELKQLMSSRKFAGFYAATAEASQTWPEDEVEHIKATEALETANGPRAVVLVGMVYCNEPYDPPFPLARAFILAHDDLPLPSDPGL
jgi:hypothetical protein